MNNQTPQTEQTSDTKYGIIWEDENCLMTDFFDTEAEAIKDFELNCGMDWSEEGMSDSHYVTGFTPEQREDSKNWPEV